MLYCICSMPHLRVSTWYLILLVALSNEIRGPDVLFLFKCGLASKVGLWHLSWNNSDGSEVIFANDVVLYPQRYEDRVPTLCTPMHTLE
jgi:hypothetical protein